MEEKKDEKKEECKEEKKEECKEEKNSTDIGKKRTFKESELPENDAADVKEKEADGSQEITTKVPET